MRTLAAERTRKTTEILKILKVKGHTLFQENILGAMHRHIKHGALGLYSRKRNNLNSGLNLD